MARLKDSGRTALRFASCDGWLIVTLIAGSACWSDLAVAQPPVTSDASKLKNEGADRVACLLPADIDRFGRQLTILGARQKIETSRADCEARGGEVLDEHGPASASRESGR